LDYGPSNGLVEAGQRIIDTQYQRFLKGVAIDLQ
jgi:hypothetical protein